MPDIPADISLFDLESGDSEWQNALAKTPKSDRTRTACMLHMQGMSYRQIAGVMGVSHSTVARCVATSEAREFMDGFREFMAAKLATNVEVAGQVALRTAAAIAADSDMPIEARIKAIELLLKYSMPYTTVGVSADATKNAVKTPTVKTSPLDLIDGA